MASCTRSRTIRNDRKERNGTSRVHTMYERRDSDRKRRERESPTQPNGWPTSVGGGKRRRWVRQSAAAVGRSRQERGLTRANGMSPYTTQGD